MIIDKILNLIKKFIISVSGRIILLTLIGGSLICFYWINIIRKDIYYPDRYEEAFEISGYLILGIIISSILLIVGFYLNRKSKTIQNKRIN